MTPIIWRSPYEGRERVAVRGRVPAGGYKLAQIPVSGHDRAQAERALKDPAQRRLHVLVETMALPHRIVTLCEPQVMLSPGFVADNRKRRKPCRACQQLAEADERGEL